jgi:hypothetical protein
MFPTRCRFCDHGNPPDAKFCSECGGALHLLPCPNCGAVNEVTVAVCYQCRSQLQGPGTDAPASDLSLAATPEAVPHRRPSVIVVAAASLATLAIGYYAYRQISTSDAPRPAAASADVGSIGKQPAVGTIAQPPVNPAPDSPKAEAATRLGRTVSLPSATPATSLAAESPKAGAGTRLGETAPQPRARAESPAAGAQTPPVRPLRVVGERGSNAPGQPCTEAVAALDLCARSPSPHEAPDTTTAAVGAATGEPKPAGPQACTEGVDALGLCSPAITQGRE